MRYFYLILLILAGLAYPLTFLSAMDHPPASKADVAAPTNYQPTKAYRALEDLLSDYKKKAADGGWPSFKVTAKKIEPGNASDRIPVIRTILTETGDFDGDTPKQPEIFDEALVEAVKKFQARHGLTDDGVLGKETQAAMNVPVEKRIRQIERTMERMQEFTPDESGRYLLVNLPEYYLRAFSDGKLVGEMRVIVGTPKNPTPTFTKQMTYVSFNPHWGVPIRIAAEEMLPKILEDPEFFTAQNLEVFELTAEGRHLVDPAAVDWSQYGKNHFPFLLRQRPGKENALGRIKFGLKDSNDIYMHDTSAPQLFAKDLRAFSHGCMRVEKPYELAQFVFQGKENWPPERVDTMYQSEESRIITVPPLSVHVVYWTAWVDSKTGAANFRKDMYGLD